MSPTVTHGTVFLGLDIGKSKHAFAFVNTDADVLEKGEIRTDKRSRQAFVSRCVKKYPDLLVGAEATGFYHESISRTFLDADVAIRILNPQLTTTKAIRSSVRSVKTDASDAEGIAQNSARSAATSGIRSLGMVSVARSKPLVAHMLICSG